MHIYGTETDSMMIGNLFSELVAGHWMMCQGRERGSLGLSRFGIWDTMIPAAAQ